ncbi:MAG: hypothetical protein JWM68_2194 [Verrucomicrobiales bacterium]|nr:hypothetical protein [Verrucomicrobiales bacterium]
MRKLAIVFVLAVFVPSLVLAWLAMRSLHDQQFVLERQQSLLYQKVADSIARDVENFLLGRQHEFAQLVEGMLPQNPMAITTNFHERIRANWPYAQVGFVVTLKGQMLSPSPASCAGFYAANATFLSSTTPSEVYWNTTKGFQQTSKAPPQKVETSQSKDTNPSFAMKTQKRSVVPQQAIAAPVAAAEDPTDSKLAPSEAEFRQIIGEQREGTLARFSDNKLNVLMWYRPPRRSDLVFGIQLALPVLIEGVKDYVQTLDAHLREEICVALLDDSAKPVARSDAKFQTNWRHPLVATEVGEELPHWEVGVYLLNPVKLTQTAQTARLTLGVLIGTLLAAIASGSWLIVHCLRKEMRLAQQKTDFVSNVSHELKTPLTSIRMFSELLAEGRVKELEKQRSYLGIITAETGRLTRLINNVLDFSHLERGEKKYHFEPCDLTEIARDTCEMYRPHLEESGFGLKCDFGAAPVRVEGDRDALAQILVNLLSNAEKYSGTSKEISVSLKGTTATDASAELTVCDRGVGVPRGSEEKIFEQFYRAHDSLSSGIQGSGLGLTLARQIARSHHGDLYYQPRDGGGSCFTLRLPTKCK